MCDRRCGCFCSLTPFIFCPERLAATEIYSCQLCLPTEWTQRPVRFLQHSEVNYSMLQHACAVGASVCDVTAV